MIEEQEVALFPYMMKRVYFYYDIVSAKPAPWEQTEKSLPPLFQLWKEEKEQLKAYFSQRDRAAARAPMIRGLSYLIVLLFWLNGRRTQNVRTWRNELELLPLVPINCVERLQFIFDRCDAYHSFVQLDKLFEEAEKLFYKQKSIMKKGMSPR